MELLAKTLGIDQVKNNIYKFMSKLKKLIVITGGAGFVGTNLIKYLLKKTNKNILSVDNYSSGNKYNHIKNKRLKYIKGDTSQIAKILKKPKIIDSIFHFGEFSRIYQSFLQMDRCYKYNTIGSNAVFNFCLKNKIHLIYSATSASIGKKGKDKNLSPYAFTKSKNLELLENYKNWFNFKYEIIYFYNVYGPHQITKGKMATVVGIFENCFKLNKPLTVVKPGTQTRRFTHINDTIKVCFLAWKKRNSRHYCISHKQAHSVLNVAKMFNKKIKFLPKRPGERFESSLISKNLSNKVHTYFGKLKLSDYVKKFISQN